jgi:hypothetical protein
MRQPSSKSTLPRIDEGREETFETEAGSRWISGRSSRAGTAANGLTERRCSQVNSDILLNEPYAGRLPRGSSEDCRCDNPSEDEMT